MYIKTLIAVAIFTGMGIRAGYSCDTHFWLVRWAKAHDKNITDEALFLKNHPKLAKRLDAKCEKAKKHKHKRKHGDPNPGTTPAASATPRPAQTPNPTSTPAITPTPFPTPSATATSTVTPVPTATSTPWLTPTSTPRAWQTPTPRPRVTPTPRPTATPTPSATPQVSPTPTPSPSASPTPTPGCTFTQGYWRNHRHWPLMHMYLGSDHYVYERDELQAILEEPVGGNGLIALAHQLIAAKLNVANGAAHDCIDQTISDADAMIGDLFVPPVGDGCLDPSETSGLVAMLTSYNQGELCSPHCGQEQGPPFRIEQIIGTCNVENPSR